MESEPKDAVEAPKAWQRAKYGGIRLIPDKYLALGAWFVLLLVYIGFSVAGKESKVIEGMLGTAFGALMMGLQTGFKRIEESSAARRNNATRE